MHSSGSTAEVHLGAPLHPPSYPPQDEVADQVQFRVVTGVLRAACDAGEFVVDADVQLLRRVGL